MGLSVLFIHPDLGIGGAERLVVDAALALKSSGCQVQVWTAHYDVNHCFSETLNSGIPIRCCGDWLPRSFLGRFLAVCAYIRMIFLAFYIVFLSGEQFDVVFCDQVSFLITLPITVRCKWLGLQYMTQAMSNRIDCTKEINSHIFCISYNPFQLLSPVLATDAVYCTCTRHQTATIQSHFSICVTTVKPG